MNSFINNSLNKLLKHKDLSKLEAESAMSEILSGNFSDIKLAAWLTALRMKEETHQEVAACASVMMKHARKIHTEDKNTVDIVGTGGDGKHTINISTASAIVASGAGLTIAKHGNRAVSSKSGSADVLTALGLNINIQPEQMELCLNKIGLSFLFAPLLHPAMKFAMPTRKALGIRTIFNILGPICNPAEIKRAVIGVYEPRLCRLLAEAAYNLGYKRLIVAYGNDGLDEISTTTTTQICEIKNNEILEYEFDPKKYGIPRATIHDIEGKDPKYNAKVIKDIFSGKVENAAKDIIILNSAAALIVGRESNDWNDALSIAEKSINNGNAQNKLQQLIEFTKSL